MGRVMSDGRNGRKVEGELSEEITKSREAML